MIWQVKDRLERNPRRGGNLMANDLTIAQSLMQRLLQNELKVKPYKFQ